MKRTIVGLTGAAVTVVAFLVGVGAGSNHPTPPPPQYLLCPHPEEDGCRADYIGEGKWVLIPEIP